MNFNKFTSRLVSAVTASAMLITGFSLFPENNMTQSFAADTVVVDTSKTYQYIRGFGGINHPEWTGSDLSAAQRQTAFGNGDNELGLTVLRVFVNPDKNQWNKALPTAQFASKLGVTIFASPWEPPANLAASGGTGGLQGKLHLPESNYAAYAQHLNDFGTYMKNNNVNLYSISVQNEPDYASEWTAWTPDQTTNFIANYGDKITSTRLMSPETFQYGAWNNGKDYYKKILANSKAMANCDLFGTHMYGTPRSAMDFPDLENSGKEIWMTEVYVPNSDADSANRYPEAIQVSENIHNAMVVGNMSAYTWWYIRRSYGLMTEDGKISKRGYCMAQYSKYVRPGAVRIAATEQPASDVLVSAYKKDNTVTVVAINKGKDGYAQSFTLGSGEKIVDVDRYRTSANENLAKTENLENDGSGFFAQLPGESVSTFVITLDGKGNTTPSNPTNPGNTDTPDQNGYYFHDTFEDGLNDWESHGSSELTMSGRIPYKDTNALLIQNREKSWNGAHKLLSSAFKGGQEYSFSVCATYVDGADTQTMKLSLQYTDTAGETKFATIATGVTAKNQYVQLANKNFKLPEGSDYMIYVETADGSDNFYIDEAIGAKAGTVIDEKLSPVLPQATTTKAPETAKTTTTVTTTKATNPPATNPPEKPSNAISGDINNDNEVDIFDMVEMRKLLANNFANAPAQADTNGDGQFSIADAVTLQNYILGMGEKLQSNASSSNSGSVSIRSMAEYTPVIQAQLSEFETADSKTEKAGVQYGTVKSGTYYSSTCGRNKPYNILLPANYSENKKYPVLYVLHGYWENQDRMILTGNGTMSTREIIGNAIAEGAAEDMIVVFPYIYSSATQENCSAMDDANNAAYDNFINDLTKDLMPHIESTYSVKTGRENTAITGFSMGGRESLLIGMQRSDLFGYIGAICPAPGVTGSFKWDSNEPYLLFITAGSNDTVVYSNPETYHNNFTQNNVPHIWHYVNGGYHGDNSIHAHLYNFVRAVFKA